MKKTIAIISSLILSINLFAQIPYGYYDGCEGLTGDQLLKKLNSITNSHTVVSYDGLWEVYKTSDVDADGKVWDMYSTKRWVVGKEHCGNYKNVGDCINREHSFPKSWFNNSSPMSSDAFHVYPTDGKVNGQRSNYPYGECANGSSVSSSNGYKALGKLGTSTFPGYSGTVFEPDDEYKGDFARSYFYMVAAYNSKVSSWDSDMLAGNSYPVFKEWAINMLLKWHRQDPVSDKEIDRNNAVYKYQHNRNPFIDHPEMAEHIWGDKKSDGWVDNNTTPQLILPVNDSQIDFGSTAPGYQVSRYVQIKGQNITESLSLSVTSSEYTLSKSTISAKDANAGTGVSITFKGKTAAVSTATLYIKSSSNKINVAVNLSAVVVNGIPALPAENIGEDSFVARWVDLGDDETYMLDVATEGASITGYPKAVAAALEEYEVTGLQPSTTYQYRLKSTTMQSEWVNVTTAALIPSIQYVSESEIHFNVAPDEPSEAAEFWLDIDNISDPLSISVDAPFSLSVDKTNWSTTINLRPGEDRFYARVESKNEGDFHSFIVIRAGAYINDDADLYATVRDQSLPWFYEDFETADKQNVKVDDYGSKVYEGRVTVWNINDAGIWSADPDKNGKYSLRLGKTSGSSLTTAEAKKNGIGSVSFYLCRWSASDGNVTMNVEYSEDGEEWILAGQAEATNETLTQFTIPVKVDGAYYLRLRQSAGKRGNIDDIVVTDYHDSGVEQVELVDLWDTYSVDGNLVIENNAFERRFCVFNIEGIMFVDQEVTRGTTSFKLPSGLYIVTDNDSARRVLVK